VFWKSANVGAALSAIELGGLFRAISVAVLEYHVRLRLRRQWSLRNDHVGKRLGLLATFRTVDTNKSDWARRSLGRFYAARRSRRVVGRALSIKAWQIDAVWFVVAFLQDCELDRVCRA